MPPTYGGAMAKEQTVIKGIVLRSVDTKESDKILTVLTAGMGKVSVVAKGDGLKYQWYYQKPGTKKWVKMSGKTKATLSFTAKKNKNGYKYRCLVKNAAGKTYTKAVKLTVK